MNCKNRSGQVMLEALVALSVILVGILGIFSLMSRSLSLNAVASSQYIASNLAAEGIEITKNIIDGNILQGNAWNIMNADDYQADYSSVSLDPYDGEPLRFNPQTGLYGYSDGDPTVYTRKITLEYVPPGGSDHVRVISAVNWTARSGATFEVVGEDHFFDWRL